MRADEHARVCSVLLHQRLASATQDPAAADWVLAIFPDGRVMPIEDDTEAAIAVAQSATSLLATANTAWSLRTALAISHINGRIYGQMNRFFRHVAVNRENDLLRFRL